jgi:hypothetical protein
MRNPDADLTFEPSDPTTYPPLIRGVYIWANAKTGYPGIVPVSRAGWLKGVADGIYPQPVQLGRAVAWRKRDVLKVLEKGGRNRRRLTMPTLRGADLGPPAPAIAGNPPRTPHEKLPTRGTRRQCRRASPGQPCRHT